MLWKCCTQYASTFRKLQWPLDWRRSAFIPITKKGNAKECSNYCTIALISRASNVMVKILQARLQQNMSRELPDVQAGFRKGRGTKDQIANIHWITEKAREFQKGINFCFMDSANVRWVQRKREWAGQSGKKRKLIRGKREGDWLLRRTSILPFWWSTCYTPPMKNSLKEWSRSWRSENWWSYSFEKIGASEITWSHLGNLVSLTDHCDLFFVWEVYVRSHLINETPCGHYQRKALTVWITTNCGKFLKRWEYQTTWPASWEICMYVKKEQLKPDMEQTGSK